MKDITVYEIEFQEGGTPKGPDYRWFSKIGQALEFMHGITGETHIVEMKFKAHVFEEGAAGVATFLNRLASTGVEPENDFPF